MKRTILLAVLLLLLLAGCSPDRPEAGQRWLLESLTVAGSTLDVNIVTPLTLEFSSKSAVAGFSGCNSYFGDLTFHKDGTLTPGLFGATEMACEQGMDLESAYLSALSRVDHYEYTGYALVLTADDGATILKFQLVQSLP